MYLAPDALDQARTNQQRIADMATNDLRNHVGEQTKLLNTATTLLQEAQNRAFQLRRENAELGVEIMALRKETDRINARLGAVVDGFRQCGLHAQAQMVLDAISGRTYMPTG